MFSAESLWKPQKKIIFYCRDIKALPPLASPLTLMVAEHFFEVKQILFLEAGRALYQPPPPRLNGTAIKKELFSLRLPLYLIN